MELKDQLKKALEELRRENEKRKFVQSIDLIINLQKFDLKKSSINIFVQVPYKIKDKKICGFLESKNKKIETITKDEFQKYAREKNKLKKLAKNFDFFIAQASLMPAVATAFGRALGPLGKMPSPQLGIIMNVDDKTITELIEKINKSVKIRTKESSIKVAIAKETMKDEEVIENILMVYNAMLKNLPRNKENIKNIEIKLTMSKPKKIIIK